MWFVSKATEEKRMAICEGCKHLSSKKTCGKPVIGGKVKHEGKTVKLCGCFMRVKTKFANQSCPLGKWGSERLTDEQKVEIRAFLSTINTDYIGRADLIKLYKFAGDAVGRELKVSNCTPCVVDIINKLRQDVAE